MNGNTLLNFDIVEVENIPKEIKKYIDNKNITTNIYIILAYDSVIY